MKWVAIALALLLLASGIFWLGRTTSISPPPAAKIETPGDPAKGDPAKTATSTVPETTTPETQAGAPTAPLDAAPAQEPAPPAPPPKPKPKTLAELDTSTLIGRAISSDDRCSNGSGNLDQTGQACAMRDQIEAILNARGYCHTSGSANWQRCAQ